MNYEEIIKALQDKISLYEEAINKSFYEIDRKSKMHLDGDLYIKTIDVKRIVRKHFGKE